MDKLFGDLKGFVVIKRKEEDWKCIIDSFVFRLHYRITLVILIAFSIAVTSRQYVGDPIDCISKDDIPTELLDTYCWIHTTFSVESAWFKKVGEEIPYPGVDKHTPGERRVYHAYYQWVCFVLFLQAMLFYIPHYLWKNVEGKKAKNIIMSYHNPVVSAEGNPKTKLLVDYLYDSKGSHCFYAAAYYTTQILNFANVVGQIFLMDVFLGGEFTKYGVKVLAFSEWDYALRYDPMIRVFPRMTKCTFHRYGSSGDVQKHDAMCLIPINILNEKIYIFLWFWFIILSILTGLELLYRAAAVLLKDFRHYILRYKCTKVNNSDLKVVLKFLDRNDWLILNMIAKNMTPSNFKVVIRDLAKKINESDPIVRHVGLSNTKQLDEKSEKQVLMAEEKGAK